MTPAPQETVVAVQESTNEDASITVMPQALKETVVLSITKAVAKMGQVTQENVGRLSRHGTVSLRLRGTSWNGADVAWAWVAMQQAVGNTAVDPNLQRCLAAKNSPVGRRAQGYSRHAPWRWAEGDG